MAGPWERYQPATPAAEGASESAPWKKYQPAPEGSGLIRRGIGDTSISLLKGAISVPEMAVGLADIVSGGQAGKLAEEAGFKPKEAKGILDGLYSPEQQAANRAVSEADGFVDTLKASVQNPSTIAQTVAESAPSMLAGGVVGRGVGALAKLPGWALGAIGEGTVGAGSAAEGTRQQTADGLLTAEQAALSAASGIGTGAIGAAGGKLASKLGIGDVQTLLAGGSTGVVAKPLPLAARIAGGAVAEGALQEAPQSMQEQALQNIALDRPVGEGVGAAAASGLLAGAVMGAGAGGMHGPGHAVEQPQVATPEVDPNAGPLSRAAQLSLPAPGIAGLLPAPDTLYADSQGNVNATGPVRNVDGTMQPDIQARSPWVNPGNGQTFGGPGMDQQVYPGAVPLTGEYQPAPAATPSQALAAQRTFDGAPIRQGIADLRGDAFIVDSNGQAVPGKASNQFAYQGAAPQDFGPGMDQQVQRGAEPMAQAQQALPSPSAITAPAARPLPGGPGMDQQAPQGARPTLATLMPTVRERAAAGQPIDVQVLAQETGASRAIAARAVDGAVAEQQALATIFKSVPGANKALNGLPVRTDFEVVKSGNREWRIQAKPQPQPEIQNADNGKGLADVGGPGSAIVAPEQPAQPAGVPDAQELSTPAAVGQLEDRAGVPAAVEGANGQRPLAPQPAAARGPRRKVDRDRDSVVQAAIRMGGVKTEWRQDTTGEAKGNKQVPGVGALWTDKTGTSIDDMASLLDQHGYVPAGEMQRDGGVSWLQGALRDELAGHKTHFAPGSARQEIESLKQEADHFAAQAQAQAQAQADTEDGTAAGDDQELLDTLSMIFDQREIAADLEARRVKAEKRAAELDELFGDTNEQAIGTPSGTEGADQTQRVAETSSGSARSEERAAGTTVEEPQPADFSLTAQTEAERQAAEKAAEVAANEAAATKKAEADKAQADADRNDFTLTGSDRPSDIGAARGQNDMFSAPQESQPSTASSIRPDLLEQQPSVEKKPKTEKIEDFGEKLDGARKFATYTQKLQDATDQNVSAVPLSKSWPQPDYAELLAQGADPWGVAFMRAARDEIPSKPSKGYKLSRWASQVESLRGMAIRASQDAEYAAHVRQKATTEFASLQGLIGRADLYAQFGHSVSLKGINFASHYYSLYRGEKNVTKWVVDKVSKASVRGNWPQELGVGNTREEAIAAFAKVHAKMAAAPEADVGPAIRFDVFSRRGGGGYFIGKKNGRRIVQLKEAGSLAEARAMIMDGYAELEAKYLALKEAPPVRGSENAPRVGADYRNGLDVTPELFDETFGFRGVQFGNYVENKRRVKDLNDAFDGLMDLAGILNVPPRALSLNGELGLAFGARGHGGPDPASAHYERDSVVINLTKAKGAGSLAHEWWHSLDNYLSRARKESANYLTAKPYERGAGVRPELVAAYKELMSTVGRTRLKQRSEELDKLRTQDYWSTPEEMSARAFESYVIAKLEDGGIRSDYLANVISEARYGREESYPYPTAAEIPAIRAAYDNIFHVIETREDEAGNVALYSRASYRQGQVNKGSRADQLSRRLSGLASGWKNAPKIEVVQSVKDLPANLQQQVERDGAFDVEGMFSDGAVYLVADNLSSVQHAAFVLQHEVLGHAGLQGAYGKRLQPLLNGIYRENKVISEAADKLSTKFGYSQEEAVEEVLADMAAAGTLQQQKFWPRLLAAMRNAIRSLGFNLQWTEADVQALLANARRFIEAGQSQARGRISFSRDGRSGRRMEVKDQQGNLLAPNGKPSRLSERQWHQTRSPQFKAWFGDWQALAVEQRLDAMKPLKLRTPEAWKGVSEKEKLTYITDALTRMAQSREVLQHAELGNVQVRKRGIKKATSSAADPAKQVVLDKLRAAFESSIYASSKPGTKGAPGQVVFHKLLSPVDVDGVPLVAVFNVQEDANGAFVYNTVTVTRKEEALAASPRDMTIAGQRSTSAITKASGDFVRQPLRRVNVDSVSKVIDGNGEPLILNHGTGEDFTVFDQGRAGRSTGHATAPLGIFLTSNAKTAKAYSAKASDGMPGLAKVMQLYASITNPYEMTVEQSQALDTPDKARAFRQQLEAKGHDGIKLVGTDTWIAFSNTQVKSATNNTGAFDSIDADIRYSRAGQRDLEALRKLGLAPKSAESLMDKFAGLKSKDWKAILGGLSSRSEEGLFDGLVGIKRAEEAVGVTDPNQQGYVSARFATGLADVMHGVMHYGAPEWRDGVIAPRAGTRGLLDVLGDIGGANLTDWLGWLGGKRAELLKAEGRENNLTDSEIAELLALGKGKEKQFEKSYREYAKINEAVLDLAEGAGLIDKASRAKWGTEYYVPFYRETEDGLFSGPRSKRGLSHQTAAIKALKGGNIPTNDLLENILTGWSKRLDASMKNKALLETVDNLKGSDFLKEETLKWTQMVVPRAEVVKKIKGDRVALEYWAEQLGLDETANHLEVAHELNKLNDKGFEELWGQTAPTDPDIIRVQRGGKNEYYRVNDESLLRGLKFIEGSVFNDPVTRIGRAFKRLLTTGVTAAPDFILRNFIRDAAHAWMINKDGFKLGVDSIKGLRDAFKQDQDYRDLMFAGSSFQGGYVHGNDPEAAAQLIRRALEKKGLNKSQRDSYMSSLITSPQKLADLLGKGWEHYREFGDRVENANRLSTYKAALAAGKSKRQAAFEAKDLMDYSLRGNFAAAQWFTDMVPFLNARLQGLYKLGRAARGDKTLIAKELAIKGGYLTLFTLALAAMNGDDDRYKELPEFDKDTNWHIFLGDQHFRIPKPFELGLLFGTVPERLLHRLTGNQDNGQLAGAVARGVFGTLAFNPVPQFYQPIREVQANRNFFFDTPIEDMSDEGKLPEARYDERTSVIAKSLGQITGPALGLSPKQLDSLIKGYTGTMGGYVLSMANLMAAGATEGESPTARVGDLPLVSAIYRGSDPRSTQYQSEFYDMMQEADQLYRTARYFRQEGRVDAAESLINDNRDKLKHRAALGAARQQLGAIRKRMDSVYRDTRMSGDEKRARLNELQLRSNQVAERMVKRAKADF